MAVESKTILFAAKTIFDIKLSEVSRFAFVGAAKIRMFRKKRTTFIQSKLLGVF